MTATHFDVHEEAFRDAYDAEVQLRRSTLKTHRTRELWAVLDQLVWRRRKAWDAMSALGF